MACHYLIKKLRQLMYWKDGQNKVREHFDLMSSGIWCKINASYNLIVVNEVYNKLSRNICKTYRLLILISIAFCIIAIRNKPQWTRRLEHLCRRSAPMPCYVDLELKLVEMTIVGLQKFSEKE